MATDLNRVIMIGRMVRDPELKYTQSGTAVARFSIANNRSYVAGGDKKENVSFFNCIAWSKLGEVIVEYCKKGKQIAIEGRLQQRSWDDQDGKKRSSVEIVVENFQFIGSKSGASEGDSHSAEYSPANEIADNPFSDDDIPF